MPRIFISHSSLDREVIEREIISPLRAHGLDTWYSTDNIKSASEWERQIHLGLKSCDWFLIVLSPWSVASEWVHREVHWAFRNRKGKIVPVMLENCEPDELHLGILPLQFIDFRDNLAQAQDRLLSFWGLDESRRVETRYQAAQDALAKEDWAAAIEHLEAVLQLDPSRAQAQADLNRARQHQQLPSLYEAALTQLREQHWREAFETLEQVRAIDGNYKDVAGLTASVNAELEKEEAERLYGEASDAVSREDWATAVEQLQAVLILDSSHAGAQAALSRAVQQRALAELHQAGLAHLQSGRWREALKSLRRVRAIDKSYKGVSDLIAEADAGIEEEEERPKREKQEREAKEEAERQAREREAQQAREQLYLDALDDIEREDWNAAGEKLRAVNAGDPDNDVIAAKLAEVERQQDLAAVFESGIQHSKNKRWAEALIDFRQVREAAGDYKNLSAHIAQVEAELKTLHEQQERERQERQAREQVERRIREEAEAQRKNEDTSPTDTTAAVFDDADTRQTKFLALSAGVVLLFIVLAFALWPKSTTSPSENSNNSATNQSSSAEDYYKRGTAFYYASKYVEAAAEFRKAIELDDQNATYHNVLGSALYWQQMYKEAAAEYRRAILLEPNNADYHNDLGLALDSMDMHQDAKVEFKKALDIDPDNKRAKLSLTLFQR